MGTLRLPVSLIQLVMSRTEHDVCLFTFRNLLTRRVTHIGAPRHRTAVACQGKNAVFKLVREFRADYPDPSSGFP